MDEPTRSVLFLCTGNYYRSRFAEEYFNALAPGRLPGWKAVSRALAKEMGSANVGSISPHTLEGLERRNLHAREPHRKPLQCTEEDLRHADRIVALKDVEHRPMLVRKFPAWPDKVTYWRVHDVDLDHPLNALAEISMKVEQLIEELGGL
jgi:protein-tyrosine phosphatase